MRQGWGTRKTAETLDLLWIWTQPGSGFMCIHDNSFCGYNTLQQKFALCEALLRFYFYLLDFSNNEIQEIGIKYFFPPPYR